MGANDTPDPKHEDAPADVTAKAPRTKIADLPPAELSEEKATQVVGGLVVNAIIAVPLAPPLTPAIQKATSIRAFTTGGANLDQDNVPDKE
jgi:hypothetical protein